MIQARSLLLVLLLSIPAAMARGDELAPKVDALFARWDRPESPGAAVAVVKGGKVIHARGYGMADLEHDVPITPRTVFHVASVSKQFTAFGIVLLSEWGRLSLDDDIRTHLKQVPDFGPKITIRQLIHHTSGLRDQWDLAAMAGWRMDDVITQAQILRLVARQRELNFAPGSEHLYCNTGYTLLAEIVQQAGGKPFPEWMSEHVFEPLKMERTLFYADHERIVKDRAYSFKRAPDGGYAKAVLNYANVGATSLFTTAEDLARWVANLGAPRVGDERTIRTMCERGRLTSGEVLDYGCGLALDEHRGLRLIGHSGGDAGYRSYVGWFPDQDLGVVVLSNFASLNAHGLALKVAEVYLEDAMAKPSSAEEAKDPQAELPRPGAIDPARRTPPYEPDALELAAYAGLYVSPELETSYRLVVEDGILVAEHARHDPRTLRPAQKDLFQGRILGRVRFERDGDGRITGFRATTGRVRNLRFERRD
jgi:CubicO group peptidase (beta-lactamase class C family)